MNRHEYWNLEREVEHLRTHDMHDVVVRMGKTLMTTHRTCLSNGHYGNHPLITKEQFGMFPDESIAERYMNYFPTTSLTTIYKQYLARLTEMETLCKEFRQGINVTMCNCCPAK